MKNKAYNFKKKKFFFLHSNRIIKQNKWEMNLNFNEWKKIKHFTMYKTKYSLIRFIKSNVFYLTSETKWSEKWKKKQNYETSIKYN